MKIVKEYPDGVFNWIDLGTTDAEGAKKFYGALFGWEFEDRPITGGGVYTMCMKNGHSICGLSQMDPEQQDQGMPPVWTSYVKHSNVDQVAERITAAGGTVMLPPMDVMDQGRMLIGIDPGGAVFGAWQPNNHIGAEYVNAPNSLVWNELQTRALDRSRGFYRSVFGWDDPTDANGYVVFQVDGRGQAGAMAIDENWGDVPNNWSVYFHVEDVDAAAARVPALGGTVVMPPTDAGDVGRFAVVQDPQGGTFSIMQFNEPPAEPPGP